MMLRDFNYIQEANDIIRAVEHCIAHNQLTIDLVKENYLTCSQLGDHLVRHILQGATQQFAKVSF